MGKFIATRKSVTVAIELDRILGAPALLWDTGKGDWVKCDKSVREMMLHILWLRLCHTHPEYADARLYEDVKISFDPETGCMKAEFIRAQPKQEQEHGVFIVDVGVPAGD
jgi:hypothetical protein